ncbi:hypothetical protein DLAC_01895 [Tieghemostelium lacteum]|uniref:F-box domain-containing protein n=1 Tax=Tieghemostelium lacteum TaxID=361077 RepID=A0A152A6L4_TIELA|nr:hypothetical protein DLAC_01895 [Tieghemostelium lacteum]|eukprot:KYR01873.1 hypothetical protein DLAC_01895 [Tieghemostelium lacteum]
MEQYTTSITQDYLIKKIINSCIKDRFVSIYDKVSLRLVSKKWYDFVHVEIDSYIIKTKNQKNKFETHGVPSSVKKLKFKYTQDKDSKFTDKMSTPLKGLEEFKYVMETPPPGVRSNDDRYLKCLNPESLKKFKYINYTKSAPFDDILKEGERIARDIGRYKIESFQFSALHTSYSIYYSIILEKLACFSHPTVLKRVNIGHKFKFYSHFISFWNDLVYIHSLYKIPELVVNHINFFQDEYNISPTSLNLAEEFFTLHLSKFTNLTRLELADLNSAPIHGKIVGKYLMDSKIKILKITNHRHTEYDLISAICQMKYLEKFVMSIRHKLLYKHSEHPKITFPHPFISPLKCIKLRGLKQKNLLGSEFTLKTPLSHDLVHIDIDIDMLDIKAFDGLSKFIQLYPNLGVLRINGKNLILVSHENQLNLLFHEVFQHQSLKELYIMGLHINDILLSRLYLAYSKDGHKSNIHVIQFHYSDHLINYLQSNNYSYSKTGNKVSLFFN